MRRVRSVKGGSPHSERAGEVVLASGERAVLYRALRELSCSRCCGVIREGELFVREAEPASGLPLVRLCRGCAPFSRGGGLLDAVLAPGGCEESRPAAAPFDAREKMLSRLGPALAAGRHHPRGTDVGRNSGDGSTPQLDSLCETTHGGVPFKSVGRKAKESKAE